MPERSESGESLAPASFQAAAEGVTAELLQGLENGRTAEELAETLMEYALQDLARR
jgi:hypothetical protein